MILYYVKKGNSFSCVLFSLLWTDLSLLVKLTSEIYLRYLSKISSEYPLFFKHILKICSFLPRLEREKFVLRKRSASPFRNPLCLHLKDHANRNSCIGRSLSLGNVLVRQRSITYLSPLTPLSLRMLFLWQI